MVTVSRACQLKVSSQKFESVTSSGKTQLVGVEDSPINPKLFMLSDNVCQQVTQLCPLTENNDDLIFTTSSNAVSSVNRNKRIRLLQFTEGRKCAAELLALMGSTDTTVGALNGAPVWPIGFVGSLTHTKMYLGVAVARQRDLRSVGIDIEEIVSSQAATDIESICLNIMERKLIKLVDLPRTLISTICFSAKESLYKCLHPLTGVFFDFSDAQILAIDIPSRKILVTLRKRLSSEFIQGATILGGFSFDSKHVYTAFELRPDQQLQPHLRSEER